MSSTAERQGPRFGYKTLSKIGVLPIILLVAASLSVQFTAVTSTQATACGMNVRTGKPGPPFGDQQEWVGSHLVQAVTGWTDRPLRLQFSYGWVSNGYGRKVIWRVRKSLQQDVTLQGRNVRTKQPMRFAIDGAPGAYQQRSGHVQRSMPSVDLRGHWRGYPSLVIVPGPGCYVLQAQWPGGGWSIQFNAVTRNRS